MSFRPTKEQQKVLDHDYRLSARVLAGPGTGKSATVIQYIEQLHATKKPPRIRLLTFTRAATAELAQKIGDDERLKPSTVHSFSISVLLKNPGAGGFPEPLRIADDWETDEIVNPSLQREMGISIRDVRKHIREMAAGWEALDDQPGSEFTKAETNRFLAVWNEHRRIWGYTLLAELPFRLREALNDHEDLEGCDIDLLVVDEYQDLNACDLALIRLLAEKRGTSVLAIGDDDQSIYSFRHAAPAGIRGFPEDFPDSGDYTLSESLRCGRKIIEWASHIIQFNRDRPNGRALLQPAKGNPDGIVGLLSFANEATEAKGIANLVRSMIEEGGLAPSEILILLRSDFNQCFSGPIKKELETLDIATADAEWVKLILAKPDNRRTLALFRLIVNVDDSLAWATLLTTTRGIGDKFIDSIYTAAKEAKTTFAQSLRSSVSEEGQTPKLVAALVTQIEDWLARNPLPEKADGWAEWILEQELPPGFGFDEPCAQLLRDVETLAETESGLGRFLGQISPLGADLAAARSDGVRIMSLAKSKGLTVRGAIIAGCEEGIIPHESAHPDEEARLMYVGMTRAKEYQYCTWARRRKGPTARVGREQVGNRRTLSNFFLNGPVKSRSGDGAG